MTDPFFSRPMRLVSRTQETPETWTLAFDPVDGKPYDYRPGQFLCVKIGNTGESRCYTISSTACMNDRPTITVMRHPQGLGSTWLTRDVKPGDVLEMSPAMGDFTCDECTNDKYLLMATGSGVTPALAMSRWLLVNRPKADVIVVYTVKSPDHIVQRDFWKMLEACRSEDFRFLCFAKNDPDEGCLTGRLNEARLKELVPDVAEREAYVCASPGFVAMSRDWCVNLGMPETHYHTEAFGPASTTACTVCK